MPASELRWTRGTCVDGVSSWRLEGASGTVAVVSRTWPELGDGRHDYGRWVYSVEIGGQALNLPTKLWRPRVPRDEVLGWVHAVAVGSRPAPSLAGELEVSRAAK